MDNRKYYEPFLNKDNFYLMDEVIEEYGSPYKITLKDSLIIKNEDLFYKYKKENLIKVNIDGENKKISKNLIHDLLSDEGMYRYLQTNLINTLGIAVRIDIIYDETQIESIKISGSELLAAIEKMEKIEELSQKEQMRKALIENTLRLYSFKRQYHDKIHSIHIDGQDILVNTSTLLDILTMDETKFEDFCSGKLDLGEKKEYLAYALVDFMERERILTKYGLPKEVVDRYRSIEEYKVIDFESLNKNRVQNDEDTDFVSIIDKISIDEDFKKEIDKYIRSEYSSFEKSIYYYLRLCELLTLDPNYFVDKSNTIIHENLANIKNINIDNNKVITFDFMLLFTKLLKELEIYYTLDQTLLNGTDSGYSKLTYKDGEYLVSLEKVDNINTSDLTNVKLNDDLMNIHCINQNQVTKQKFNEIVEKIYKQIVEKREQQEKFKDALTRYQSQYDVEHIDTKDKLYILIKTLARNELKGMDLLAYERKIFTNLFYENNNIKLNFIINTEKSNVEFNLTPSMVISIYSNGQYTYFVINPNTQDIIIEMTREEIIDMFETQNYYYLDSTEIIPGIEVEKGKVYAR